MMFLNELKTFKEKQQKQKERVIGALVGLAVGDAMGAPYEFKEPPYDVSINYTTGGYHNVSIGEWTDDTAMALCLTQSLIEMNGFDARSQMEKYLAWWELGYYSPRGSSFGIGRTVMNALKQYKKSQDPYSGIAGDTNSGNGSLMRLSPIAMYYYANHEDLIKYAALSSKTTHKSEIAVDACVYFAQLLAGAINGLTKSELLNKNFCDLSRFRKEVQDVARGSYKQNKVFKPTGYVIDTLETALMTYYKHDSFEAGMLELLGLGYDVDTVCAVYGQLAGAYYGYQSIPIRWLDDLVLYELLYDKALSLYICSKEIDL